MPEVKVDIKGGAKEAKDSKVAKTEEKRPPQQKVADRPLPPGVKPIVRIATTDIPGGLPTVTALRKIKGISFMFANAVCLSTGVDGKKAVGALSDKELESVQTFIQSQAQSPTLPKWMINRRNDPETGTDGHLIATNLTFRQREDINFLKRIRCRRGIRHELGLPVRGQHTKSTGRHGRGVGVMRKTAAAAAAPVAAPKTAAPAAKPAASAAKPEAKK